MQLVNCQGTYLLNTIYRAVGWCHAPSPPYLKGGAPVRTLGRGDITETDCSAVECSIDTAVFVETESPSHGLRRDSPL